MFYKCTIFKKLSVVKNTPKMAKLLTQGGVGGGLGSSENKNIFDPSKIDQKLTFEHSRL